MDTNHSETSTRRILGRTFRDSAKLPAIRSPEEIAEAILRRAREATLYTPDELARIKAADETIVRDLRQLMLVVLEISAGVKP